MVQADQFQVKQKAASFLRAQNFQQDFNALSLKVNKPVRDTEYPRKKNKYDRQEQNKQPEKAIRREQMILT